MTEQQTHSQLAIDLAISDVLVGALRIRDNLDPSEGLKESASFLAKYFDRQLSEGFDEVNDKTVVEDSKRRQLQEALSRIPRIRASRTFKNPELARKIHFLLSEMKENKLSPGRAEELLSSIIQLSETSNEMAEVA